MSSAKKTLSQVRKRKRDHGSTTLTLLEDFEPNSKNGDQQGENAMLGSPYEPSHGQVSLSENFDGTCVRCSSLKIDRLLHTTDVRTYADIKHISGVVPGMSRNLHHPRGSTQIDLGLFREMVFNPQCSLCKLLRGLMDPTINEADEHVFLIPALSIHRLEPDISMVRYGEDCKYVNYLYLGQMVEKHGQRRLPYCHEVPNAIGYALTLEPDHAKQAMRIRPVNPSQVDIELVHHWLSSCERNHGDVCRVLTCPALGIIRLIDVEDRKIVPYSEIQDPQYLCLSYVWGQQGMLVDTTLGDLPPTISDAMKFVRLLGKRYLWVDMLCINQQDSSDKTRHIEIMNKIYSGALATIVALDADDAYSGIPRVNPRADGVVKAKQLSYLHDGKLLLTALPTLQQQANKSKWATRAWTYQEAILFPRCLYFTADQVYFECNSVQCCESIDESNSSFHSILEEDRKEMVHSCICHGGSQNAIGKGVFRDPLSTTKLEHYPTVKKHRLERYNQLLEEYSSRTMTYNSDALNAFEAVLQQLSAASFTEGCFSGIPVEILQGALLFEHWESPTRRAGFPSWSWTGWKGKLFKASLVVETPYQPPFKAWKARKTTMGYEPVLLYESSQTRWPDWKPGYDPILDAMFTPENKLQALLTSYRSFPDLSQALFVNAILFQPGLLKLCSNPCADGFRHSLGAYRFHRRINQVDCHFICYDIETKNAMGYGPVDLLLIERNCYDHFGWTYEYLLLGMLPDGEKGAQRIGRVKMYFGNSDEHNKSSCMVFTSETMQMDILALF